MTFRYPAFLESDGDLMLVRFHDFPEIFCVGADEEEAIFNAGEALADMLTWHIDQGLDIPYPTPNINGSIRITPNPTVQSVLSRHFDRGTSRKTKPSADMPPASRVRNGHPDPG